MDASQEVALTEYPVTLSMTRIHQYLNVIDAGGRCQLWKQSNIQWNHVCVTISLFTCMDNLTNMWFGWCVSYPVVCARKVS